MWYKSLNYLVDDSHDTCDTSLVNDLVDKSHDTCDTSQWITWLITGMTRVTSQWITGLIHSWHMWHKSVSYLVDDSHDTYDTSQWIACLIQPWHWVKKVITINWQVRWRQYFVRLNWLQLGWQHSDWLDSESWLDCITEHDQKRK